MTLETENLIAAAIDAAEEFSGTLEGLIGRTSQDPGVPIRTRAAGKSLCPQERGSGRV